MKQVRIHRYLSRSRVNGPGQRFCLWLQGCSQYCHGCFNLETHDFKGGVGMTVDQILDLVRKEVSLGLDGFTVSGGEPFEQPAALFAILQGVRGLSLETMVYSGYTYEHLSARYPDILREIDILVDGAYMQAESPHHKWAGSGNQRVLYLREGKIAREDGGENDVVPQGEIIIERDGSVISTGFISL